MSLDPDFARRDSRFLSACSDDSVDQRHRHVRIETGYQLSRHGTFDIEQPVVLTISGEWTPAQVWNEYQAKLQKSFLYSPKAQLFFAHNQEEPRVSFDDPIVLPFFDKPIYHWENWNTCQKPLRDGDRIVFVMLHFT